MKRLLISILLVTSLLGANALASDSKTTSLYNFKEGRFDTVNVETVTEEQAKDYLPDNPTVKKLFEVYKEQGNGVGYALISTVLDMKEASQGGASIMFNFKTGKKESVAIDKLTPQEAKAYIPQHPSALQLFDFYYSESGDIASAIKKTLMDTMEVIKSIPQQ